MHGILRKAGQKIREFDDAYSRRVIQDSGRMPLTQMLGGTPLTYKVQPSPGKELAMEMAKEGQGPASKGMIQRHQAAETALGVGLMATSAGYRYGLPAAGITLAGKGLIDTASMLGQQTSGTLDPE